MGNAAENLVHESETQRQYVRVSLPARARVGNKDYIVSDLSSGGMSIQNSDAGFKKGDQINTLLTLPFKSFSMDIELEAEARHTNNATKSAGFRFVNLTPEQTSLLNHVLRSFIAGEIVAGNDLLAVVSRENFVKVRHHSDVESDKSTFWKRQALPFTIIALLGLTAFFIIVQNIYNSAFVLESSQAYVSGNEFEIRSPVDGIFETSIADDLVSLQKNQLIGMVASTQAASPISPKISVTSPCDCYIVSRSVDQGEFAAKGTEILSLVSTSDTLWVTAIISTADSQRIRVGDEADIFVAGSDVELSGTIESFSVNKSGGAVIPASEGFDTGVQVKIKANQKLPVDLIGRPATVGFHL